MWTLLAFISALCLGFYDISKKIASRENKVIDVLTISVCVSALFLSIPLILPLSVVSPMQATRPMWTLVGACSGLYDKYLMRRYDHNAVQVYYTFYQAIMMLIMWVIFNRKNLSPLSRLQDIKKNRRYRDDKPISDCFRQCLYARLAGSGFDVIKP